MGVLAGIDEVGRGCWAGPLVAAAVILRGNNSYKHLRSWKLADSKLLTRKQRQIADNKIRKIAKAIGIGWVSPAQVDELGLTASVRLAMQSAFRQILIDCDEVVIDGHYNFLADNQKAYALVRADKLIPEVSAASIIAKVARDNYMINISKTYAKYSFETHVGYGTKLHRDLLKIHGPCELHRRSYKPIMELLV